MQRFDAWHKTRAGFLVFAVVELGLAYGFASLSISRGNFWWYLLTLVFLVGFLQNFFKFAGSFKKGSSTRGR